LIRLFLMSILLNCDTKIINSSVLQYKNVEIFGQRVLYDFHILEADN
jgi:hypothetical protein